MTPHERALEAAKAACIEIMGPPFGTPEYIAKHSERLIKRRDDAAEAYARAAVTAYLEALQETHELVPREPTIGMLRALVASWPEQERAAIWTLGSFREDYRAMIDAAPPAAREPRS